LGISHQASASEIPDELRDLTDEARTSYHSEVRRYGDELLARTRGRTQAEIIRKQDIEATVAEMKRRNVKESWRILADWTKRVGILLVGFAVAQFIRVRTESPISQGSVNWLLADALAAALLLACGVVLDKASLRSQS
jgi:hypothetical protein